MTEPSAVFLKAQTHTYEDWPELSQVEVFNLPPQAIFSHKMPHMEAADSLTASTCKDQVLAANAEASFLFSQARN